MEKILIPSTKGMLAAVIHRPTVQSEKLAILCPGYLDSKDYTHLVMLADDLASLGFTAVRFDPTGTWESGGDISEYTTTQYLEDVKTVIDYMLTQNNFKHILIGGHSRGGQISVLYAARDPRISEVLAIMPSSKPLPPGPKREEWEKDGFHISTRDIPGQSDIREYKVPFTHIIDRDQYNAVEQVKNVHVPTIFIAGELDTTILPEVVKELFDAANEPKQYIFLEGMGHDYRKDVEKVKKVNKIILKFYV
jgi:pimeloyl-ACP methyl ester carboxylesterase